MNSEAKPPEAALLTASPAARAHKTFGAAGIVAVLALVLLAAQWFDSRQRLAGVQEEFARRLAESDSQAKEARVIARQNQETIQSLQAKLGVVEARQAESQGQQIALEALYQEFSRSRDERLVAEAEQAVAIAAQQLQLAGNVEAALIALSGADARLARAAQPQFLAVRKLIARDIDRLRASPTADVPGMAMRLESVIAGVDALPLAYEQRPRIDISRKATAVTEAPLWQRLLADAWAELRQMIRIERIDRPDPGLLAPQQSFFLRENLKLRLVNARMALLARDGKSFREDMRQASEWLDRYFDGRAKPVQAAQAVVKSLGATDLAVALPTLNDTLAALRNFKAARK